MVQPAQPHWRLEKAERFLTTASLCLEAADYESAVSRAYYAAYHAAIAALEQRGGLQRRRWDHDQVQVDFDALFARRGFLFNRRDVDDLVVLHEFRIRADYRDDPISSRQAERLVARARIFCAKVRGVIA